MWYFLQKIGKRPGTWVFLALAAIVLGMLVPLAAPGLVITAAVMIGLAAATLPFYIKGFFTRGDNNNASAIDAAGENVGGYGIKKPVTLADPISYFFKNHPVQAAILVIGMLGFITTLVLTIGFFTGGAGFVFMAPLFAALSAPFAAAATAGGISLAIPVLAGFTLVLASLNLTNVLKSLVAWVDSFKYDRAASDSLEFGVGENWIKSSRTPQASVAEEVNGDDVTLFKYFGSLLYGMKATIVPDEDKPILTSPDAMRIDGKKLTGLRL